MEYCVSAGAGRGVRPTFWVGFSLILLAAGLNLAVAAAAEFAPRALPMGAYVVYEESKSVVTLTLVAMGLALILRAALAQPAGEPRDAGPEKIAPLALLARSGGIQLVTTRYLPTTRAWGSAPAVEVVSDPQVEADDDA